MLFSCMPMSAFAAAADAPSLTEGSYKVPITGLKSGAPIPAVATEFEKAFGTHVQIAVDAAGKMTATIHPQHMVVKLSGDNHCNILKLRTAAGEAEYSDVKDQKVTVGQVGGETQPIQAPGTMKIAMPAYNEAVNVGKGNPIPGYPFELTADFMNGLHGNVNVDHWMTVALQLDLSKAEKLGGGSEPEAPKGGFGSAGTVLEAGKYNLPITMYKKADKAAISGEKAAFDKAILTVNADGSADVDLSMVGINQMFCGDTWIHTFAVAPKVGGATKPCEMVVNEKKRTSSVHFRLSTPADDGVTCDYGMPMNGNTAPEGIFTRYGYFLGMDFAKATKIVEKKSFPFGSSGTMLAEGKYDR